jgi:hypothetical protein
VDGVDNRAAADNPDFFPQNVHLGETPRAIPDSPDGRMTGAIRSMTRADAGSAARFGPALMINRVGSNFTGGKRDRILRLVWRRSGSVWKER